MLVRPLLVALATLTVGCGGTGKLKLSLTDAPADLSNVSEVNITVDEIRIHSEGTSTAPDGGSAQDSEEGVNGKGWIILCSDVRTYDLMKLTDGRFAPLCSSATADGGSEVREIEVPAGRISQLRLHLSAAGLVFKDGTPPTSLTVPSGAQSGLKINVQRDVPAGGVLDLKLDFDAASSINKQGNGGYKLAPVLKVLP